MRYLDDSSTNNTQGKLISNPPLKQQWFPGIRGGILQNVWKSKTCIFILIGGKLNSLVGGEKSKINTAFVSNGYTHTNIYFYIQYI